MIAVALFSIIALVHVHRLFTGWEIVVAGSAVPLWISWPGLVIAGGLAIMVAREARA